MNDFELINRLRRDEYKTEFNEFYDVIKKYFYNKNDAEPGMTDHGLQHIKNVMENADKLLESNPFPLHEKDILYLCEAICIHDLAMGNFSNIREGHHVKIHEVFEQILDDNKSLHSIIQTENQSIICKIAAAHSGKANEAYNVVKDNSLNLEMSKDTPHLLFLSMLLRISDELDITQKRIKNYILSAIFPKIDKKSQLHWIKHQSIASWHLLSEDRSYITLSLVPDILDKFIPKYELDIGRDEYISFMLESLSKLQNELETIFEYCDREREANWRLRKLTLKNLDDSTTNNSEYIHILNEMLLSNKKSLHESEEEMMPSSSVDEKIRIEREKKNRKNYSPNTSADEERYFIIGGDKYRDKLNNYIKESSMLRQGCYKHREIRILSWLDSFGFHQNYSLLHESSNIIARDIENRDIDIIIGLGLKGAKIATIVGLRLDKPVLFFINDKINMYDNIDSNKIYNIVMITDCIITGMTALSCIEKLHENKLNNKIIGVYGVFIRNHAKNNILNNQLMEQEIPIYAINDSFPYNTCSFEEQQDCPLYRTYGEKNYERLYKRSKELPNS